MSNHLSKSLFSIPRLKKSRSRQQNQPENPTSLCLNALTADDAFLRFAAVPDKTFFSPRNPERNFIFSLYIHPPSAAARGSRAALQYFRSYRPPFTTRGTGSPYMPNTSNDRARNALRSAETEKFSRPQTLLPSQIRVQGDPATQDGYKKRMYPSARQGIYYTGIIGGGRGGGEDNNTEIYMTVERRRGRY